MSTERQQIFDQARQLFREAQYLESLALLDRLERILTDDKKTAMLARIKCLVRLGRHGEARRAADELAHVYGDDRGLTLLRVPGGGRRRFPWVKWLLVYPLLFLTLGGTLFAAGAFYVIIRADNPPLVDVRQSIRIFPWKTTGYKPETTPPVLPPSAPPSAEAPAPAAPIPAPAVVSEPVSITPVAPIAPVPDPPAPPQPVIPPQSAAPPAEKALPMVASVVELQPRRTVQELSNARGDKVTLINLNPAVGAWYLLDIGTGGRQISLHLEAVPEPGTLYRPAVSLYRDGLALARPGGTEHHALWAPRDAAQTPPPPDAAALNPAPVFPEYANPDHRFAAPYTAICDGALLVRAQKPGSATRMEAATDLLRTTRLGEWFVAASKPYLIEAPETAHDGVASAADKAVDASLIRPHDALVDPARADASCTAAQFAVAMTAPGAPLYGRWYAANNHPGVFLGVMKAEAAVPQVLKSFRDRVGPLVRNEGDSLVYLAAFDLSQFGFGFCLGADHPKLGWSKRCRLRDPNLAGPDGPGETAPLATVGAVPPYLAPLVAATFVGGFKREHSAFSSGPLAAINRGSHFGFMQDGVVFSRLQPGLATAVVGKDGSFNLLTWPQDDAALLDSIEDARQNCVPIIEGWDPVQGSIPGECVNKWGEGSWSGDLKGDFLTLRSAIAIQDTPHGAYLLFAFFTGATPNAMARVFQAYQCRYAMLLDMNTPNYCYCALYDRDRAGQLEQVEYLHKEMVIGNGSDGSLKFLDKNDTRDFFFLLRGRPQLQTARNMN